MFTIQFKIMRETEKICHLFDDLQQGDCWIGLNMQQVLEGVSNSTAAQKLHEKGNCIWQLVNHIIYWRKTVMIRLQGKNAQPPMPDMYLPDQPDDTSWQTTLAHFEEVYRQLHQMITGFDESALDKASPMKGQTYYQLLMGCLQHDAYHMGQIQLIKKAL